MITYDFIFLDWKHGYRYDVEVGSATNLNAAIWAGLYELPNQDYAIIVNRKYLH
jgi:hypothetical protein